MDRIAPIHCTLAFPQFYRHFSWRSFLLALKLKRAELIEVLVAPNPIVEAFNVIKDFWFGLSSCGVNVILNLFTLQVTEEWFSHCTIPAVTAATHAWAQPVIFAPTVELITARMMTDSLGFLRQTAIVSASSTKLVCIRDPILQPTTARECRSSTAARYNQPSCVRIYVMSVTQAWSGLSCWNWRCMALASSVTSDPLATLNLLTQL